jgi:hypothetical protein
MLTRLKSHYAQKADPVEILEQVRPLAQDVDRVFISSRNLMALLESGAPVMAREVSGLIDQAEAVKLVSREGMKVSGLYYAAHESAMTLKGFGITAEEGMGTARHIFLEASRARNVLNRKPGCYQPRESTLYGATVAEWTPLIP